MRLVCYAFVLLAAAISVLSSSGDRQLEFKVCVAACEAQNCGSPYRLSLPFRLTGWTCSDDCTYRCMQDLTNKALENNAPIQQYYGKWPFWRFAGMQEPASVAFSLLNLWFHLDGARRIQKDVPNNHPLKRYQLLWTYASMNAWIWSSVFHTRDLPWTEKMDYFSAALAILYGLYYAVVRLFHLYAVDQRHRFALPMNYSASRRAYTVWTYSCVIVYLCHVAYLTSLPRFDYTYNMVFNLAIGLSHNAIWLVYSFPSSLPLVHRFPSRPKSYRPSYARKAAIFVALTTGATALELFDFPPWWRMIDAHALWHLTTAPIAMFWYDFMVQDALDEGWRGIRV